VRRPRGGPVEIPIDPADALGNEWAVVVDAPGYAACLLAWEQPGVGEPGGADDRDRRFEAIWTLDPAATRRAAQVAARLAGRADPAYGEHLEALLADRPLALEEPAPALTALTNRMVAYLEAAG
jgi:DICT domain-containing protein